MGGPVRIEGVAPGVTALVLDRPERRNALSLEMLDALGAALDRLSVDPAQRVVILRGEGPVFCAGLDLREAADETLIERSSAGVARALRLLHETPLVTIAAVAGGAYAGGAGLVAACDLAIAADDALFSFPEVRRGLLPALISEALCRKLRAGDLCELLLAAEPFGAVHAQRVGLVQRVVPAAEVLPEALRLAHAVLAGAPGAVRGAKALLNARFAGGGHDDLGPLHRAARRGPEALEGLRAFAEKRPPNWIKEHAP